MLNILSSLVPSRKTKREVFAFVAVFLGYTIESFALYGTGDIRTGYYVENCLDEKCLDHLSADWNLLLNNRLRLALSVVMAFALAASSQKNYGEMVKDLSDKIDPLTDEYFSSDVDVQKNKSKLKEYLAKISDIIATQTKVFVSIGSLLDIVMLFVGNPYAALGLSAALNIIFGELAQFAVLGKNYDIKVFMRAFLSSIETLFLSSVVYPLLRFAFVVPNFGMKTYYTFRILTIVESACVTLTNNTVLGFCAAKMAGLVMRKRNLPMETENDWSDGNSMHSFTGNRSWLPLNDKMDGFTSTNNFRTQRFLAFIAVLLGYTVQNFAIYGTGDIRFSHFVKDCLNGQCPDHLPSDWNLLLNDPAILTVCLIAGFALAFANQKNYTELAMRLFAKINPLYQEYVRQKHSNKNGFYEFLKKAVDIIATHTKVFVAMGSLFELTNLIIGNTYFTLGLTSILSVAFSELAQFAVLGKNYDINVFFKALIAAVETLFISSAIYPLFRYVFELANFGLITFITFRTLTFVESACVALTDNSILSLGYTTIMQWVGQLHDEKEEQKPLLLKSTEEIPKKTSWFAGMWKLCCGSTQSEIKESAESDNSDYDSDFYAGSGLVN